MNLPKYAREFVLVFAIVLVVGVVVTFCYSLIFHGAGIAELETSVRLALILGIALPLIRQREKP